MSVCGVGVGSECRVGSIRVKFSSRVFSIPDAPVGRVEYVNEDPVEKFAREGHQRMKIDPTCSLLWGREGATRERRPRALARPGQRAELASRSVRRRGRRPGATSSPMDRGRAGAARAEIAAPQGGRAR